MVANRPQVPGRAPGALCVLRNMNMKQPENDRVPECPHCGKPLRRFTLPDNTGWHEPYQWACFNDDCPYYRDGWEWMWTQYRVRSSYRYRITDVESGRASPLAVWSPQALKDRILDD